ncbi:MAG: uracil-DNA glycosylase family protein [Oceanospirillaceae bacterium]|nr:uracil-DNA glycosylase family protein [Oceanospirillaceae bacterium]
MQTLPVSGKTPEFESLVADVKSCTICKNHLPSGVRPVFQLHPAASILIAGQAPGRKVHQSGIPFDDASGRRLREWLGISVEDFYNPEVVAILPMGFCYPGTGISGDLPPRSECEPAWRALLLAQLPHLKITIVLGKYAHDYHFGNKKQSLTQNVQAWQDHWPHRVPMPHPSPRNNRWLSQNRWFQAQLIPRLQKRIGAILAQ